MAWQLRVCVRAILIYKQMGNELSKIESFRAELAKAETFEEISFIKSQADAVAEFAKRLKLSKEKQDEIGMFRIQVESEQGKWLEKHFPSNVRVDRKSTGSTDEPVQSISEIGINKHQSSQSRLISKEPDLVQEAIEEIKKDNKQVVTPNAVQKIVRKKKHQQKINEIVQKEEIPEVDQILIDKLKNGETIVININKNIHVLDYAKKNNKYQQIDRFSEWGNPFYLDSDGSRDEVCNAYEIYLKHKKSLHKKIPGLKGKALGCHCYPDRCHGNHLKELADEF
jgi:hypothetical protein